MFEKISDNLPKSEEKIESAFEECAKDKRIIEKVKTFISVPTEFHKDYIDSSLRALDAAKTLLENKNFEWVVVPAYSAIFQAANAILIKEEGKECRDHFCLLISLLRMKKIGSKNLKGVTEIKTRLDRLPDDMISFASKLRLVRSSVIYKPSSDYNEGNIAKDTFDKAKEFVNEAISILK